MSNIAFWEQFDQHPLVSSSRIPTAVNGRIVGGAKEYPGKTLWDGARVRTAHDHVFIIVC